MTSKSAETSTEPSNSVEPSTEPPTEPSTDHNGNHENGLPDSAFAQVQAAIVGNSDESFLANQRRHSIVTPEAAAAKHDGAEDATELPLVESQ